MKTKFEYVTFRNFMSFGNKPTTFELDHDKVILIIGENKDIGDSGESRNGVGKTTLLNAIVFALYGKGIEPLKVEEYINIINEKDLHVELGFSVGEDKFKVVRTRKPNAVEFYMNDESLTLDSMANTDELIATYVGFDYEVFMTMFFLSPVKRPFMGMKGAEQRDIMEKILSLDTLSKRAEALKVINSDKQTELKLAERDHENAIQNKKRIEDNIRRLSDKHAQHIDELKSDVQSNKAVLETASILDFDAIEEEYKRVASVELELLKKKEEIREIEVSINNTSRDIVDIEKYVDTVTSNLSKVDVWDQNNAKEISTIEEELSGLIEFSEVKSLLSVFDNKEQLNDKLEKLARDERLEMRGVSPLEEKIEEKQQFLDVLEQGKCPTCNQRHVDDDLINKTNKEIAAVEESLSLVNQKILGLQDEIVVVESDIAKLEQEVSGVTKKELILELDRRDRLSRDVERLKAQNNPYRTEDTQSDVDAGKIEIESQKKILEALEDDLSVLKESLVVLGDDAKLTGQAKTVPLNELPLLRKARVECQEAIDKSSYLIEKDWSPFTEELKIAKDSEVNTDDTLDAINELEDDIRHIKYLSKLLTDNKSFIRRNIVDQYIPYVNKKIVEYSTKVDLSHVAQINSDMSVDIDYMARPVSFGSLSAGEKMRLNVATTAAFNDLLGMLGKGSNLMLIDELFDSSLDPGGMHKSFKFVTDFAKNILMISHRQELVGEVDEIITIRKENGFSSII